MFDTVRFWAYKAIRAHRGSTFDVWLGKVLEQCQNANSAFIEPLPYSEVKATAKSIARYCWKKDGYHYQEFIDRQSRKGAMGGRSLNACLLMVQKPVQSRGNLWGLVELHFIAEKMRLDKPKSDNSPFCGFWYVLGVTVQA